MLCCIDVTKSRILARNEESNSFLECKGARQLELQLGGPSGSEASVTSLTQCYF
jgi:hypothetical protein